MFRWCYKEGVQTDSPAPPGFHRDPNSKVCVMTFFANIERQADRFAPLALLVVGMLTAFATAGLGA